MAAGAGLDRAAVVTAAGDLADREGLEAVTLARVAATLGVRSPSLYHHVGSLDGLRTAIGADAQNRLTAVLGEAATGRAGDDALHALATAYRTWAHEHPGRYDASLRALSEDDPSVATSKGAVDVIVAALRGWDLSEEDAVHAVRAVRAALHGFVALENAGGFALPVDRETSFRRLVDGLADAFGAPSKHPRAR